jgi:predicted Zn-dependent protease
VAPERGARASGEDAFFSIAERAVASLRGDEVLLLNWAAEDSDFVRFNRSRVRQAGSVVDRSLALELVRGKRHAQARLTLAGDGAIDEPRIRAAIAKLRDVLEVVPEDPHLLYATEIRSSRRRHGVPPPPREEVLGAVDSIAKDRDLVGIWAAGGIERGFASSFGQRNWHETESFHLDWSYYLQADRAVTTSYAGLEWDRHELDARAERAAAELAALARPARKVAPGRYRVYLAPSALEELFDLLAWGGFSLRAHRSKTTPLLRMIEHGARLAPSLHASENLAGGLAPDFQEQGFLRPPTVELVAGGVYRDCLVSPRSAIEYGVATNGATNGESPLSLDVAAGTLETDRVLRELGTGLYVGNLWYLNFSDRNACRTTGMTRFATFWVENGEIVSPIEAMRFDDTVYRILGENLVGLTREREMRLDASTYGGRSTRTRHLPGALVDDFTLTL